MAQSHFYCANIHLVVFRSASMYVLCIGHGPLLRFQIMLLYIAFLCSIILLLVVVVVVVFVSTVIVLNHFALLSSTKLTLEVFPWPWLSCSASCFSLLSSSVQLTPPNLIMSFYLCMLHVIFIVLPRFGKLLNQRTNNKSNW